LWYVLIGDQQSYFTVPLNPAVTNKPARTNTAASISEPSWPLLPDVPRSSISTNGAGKPGMIAELSVPEEAEAARVVLSQIVKDLKQQPLFSKVDLLPEELKRGIVDPKVTIPDKDFVLELDFAQTDFLQPVAPRKPPPTGRFPRHSSSRPASGNEQETTSPVSP
jgi:hypothetical protein